jgi:two-component system chemotaxis response regulator CheY
MRAAGTDGLKNCRPVPIEGPEASVQLRVLLVDDDRMVRFLLKSILVRSLGAAVTEAGNGLEALEQLSQGRVDLAVLDINMPVMNGLDTLLAIRESADHASLPVIMISSDADAVLVRRCIALGINDYITKPFNADQITSRLGRFRTGVPAPAGPATPTRTAADDAPPIQPDGPVLVAEGNAEYRQFVVSALKPRFTVLEADSGARALRMCFDAQPSVVLVGMGLGVLGPERLIEQARRAALPHTRFVGLIPKMAVNAPRATFDHTITRGFLRETFLQQFGAFLTPQHAPLQELFTAIRADLISATEQVCGMVLATEATLASEVPPLTPGDRFAARIRLSGNTEPLTLQLEIRCDLNSARLMSKHAEPGAVDSAADEDLVVSLREPVTIIADRLQQTLAERGVTVTGTPPELDAHGASSERASDDHELYFASATSGLAFRVRLMMQSSEEQAAAPSAAA